MIQTTDTRPSAHQIWRCASLKTRAMAGGADYIASVVAEVAAADHTSAGEDNARLIDAASGWHQADAGTVLSSHSYDAPSVRPSILSCPYARHSSQLLWPSLLFELM